MSRSPHLTVAAQWLVCAIVGSWALHHLLAAIYGWTPGAASVAALVTAAVSLASLVGMLATGEPWRGRAHAGAATVLTLWFLAVVLAIVTGMDGSPPQVIGALLIGAPVSVGVANTAVLAGVQNSLAGRETKHALYRFYDRAGVLLYIGITSWTDRRFNQHEDDKPWFGEVARVQITYWPTRAALEATEKLQIRRLRPRHNRKGNPDWERRKVAA